MPYVYEIDICCILACNIFSWSVTRDAKKDRIPKKDVFHKNIFTDHVEIKKAMSELVKLLFNVKTCFFINA